ncbi:diguanylate cyclase [Pedobacter cryophilus]|uniref:Diguanylate cyclase n=1 Tax=Pedobacter cryophilus TaxID=2571271 RepID=A0A4U1BXK0_9SPHI|nr:diguanylate cyclase [Pedobacter cryophilus]TKB97756.1 diguanylate cyclase [Pedobacter cryophilus]
MKNEEILNENIKLNQENKILLFQNEEKTSELEKINLEMQYQKTENTNLYLDQKNKAAELVIADKELHFQKSEKDKRAAELVIADEELCFQKSEKKDRAKELSIAYENLLIENEEKEKQMIALKIANKKLHKAEKFQKEYIEGLEKVIFIISHKIRHSIVQLLGLDILLSFTKNSKEELIKMRVFFKKSVTGLDICTQELTQFLDKLKQRIIGVKK